MLTAADEQRLAEQVHRLRVLRGDIAAGRPDIAGADDAIDDCLALLDEAETNLKAAQLAVADALANPADLVETQRGVFSVRPDAYP